MMLFGYSESQAISPFDIEWSGTTSWEDTQTSKEKLSGQSILVPIKHSKISGIILRSKGYTEEREAISRYQILSDGTIIFLTTYDKTIAEERIWFINQNVRCRSSVIKSREMNAILQTSFASEIRKLKQ